ncbi:MAG: cupin domain-containing protein, partial [Actinomycetota bacterium]|nr:cupin domain-containing protein [Actinomycetota bacterium]
MGADLRTGMRPQLLIPGGTFHTSRLPQGGWALLASTEWPGVEPPDVEPGDPEALAASHRAWRCSSTPSSPPTATPTPGSSFRWRSSRGCGVLRSRGLLLGLLTVLPLLTGCDPARSTVNRPDDPVVLTGSALPRLRGRAPGRIVAFRVTSGSWQQVPVQVDERAVVDFGVPPSTTPGPGVMGTVYGTSPSGVTALQYTDPG